MSKASPNLSLDLAASNGQVFTTLVHITTGTHVAQICLFLLTESRHLPGRLIQTSPPSERQPRHLAEAGQYSIIDLDLSRYDRIAARFAEEQREALTFLKNGIATRNAAYRLIFLGRASSPALSTQNRRTAQSIFQDNPHVHVHLAQGVSRASEP